ncbi:hypothetical protein Hanom_Chr01g00042551 [Helianthus anomalus]
MFCYKIFINKCTNMMIISYQHISCHLIRCCVHFKILGYNLCWLHNEKLLL